MFCVICPIDRNGYKYEEQQKIPLKVQNYKCSVTDRACSIEITQSFVNEGKIDLETTYLLNPPAGSAVYECTATIDGQVVNAVIKEKKQAKREYNEAVENGDTAMYMGTDDLSSFRLNLGRIQPGANVTVVVKLITELSNDETYKALRLIVPLTIGERYCPAYMFGQDQDTNVSSSRSKKIETRPYEMSIFGEVKLSAEMVSVESLKHKIKLSSCDFKNGFCRFEITDIEKLDTDVVIKIERENSVTSAVSYNGKLEGKRDEIVKKHPELANVTCFNIVPNFEGMTKPDPGDGVYAVLIDRSGSMGMSDGSNMTRMQAAIEAAQNIVASLPNKATIHIFEFDDNCKELAVSSSAQTVREKKNDLCAQIAKLEERGSTELLTALKFMVSKLQVYGKNIPFIVLTDGDIGNNLDIYKYVSSIPWINVFVLGISDEVTQEAIRGLASHGHGRAEFVGSSEPKSAIKTKIMSLMKSAGETLRNQMDNYDITVNTIGGKVVMLPDEKTPLFEDVDNTRYFFTEYPVLSIDFTKYAGDNRTPVVERFVPTVVENESIQKLAGIKYLDSLLAKETLTKKADKKASKHGSKNPNMEEFEKEDVSLEEFKVQGALREQIINTSIALNVVSPHTAFIGVKLNNQQDVGEMDYVEVPLQRQRSMNKSMNKSMAAACGVPAGALMSLNAMSAPVRKSSSYMVEAMSVEDDECMMDMDECEGASPSVAYGMPSHSYLKTSKTKKQVVPDVVYAPPKIIITVKFDAEQLFGGILTITTDNISLATFLEKLGYSAADLNNGDCIELTVEEDSSANGVYVIEELGADGKSPFVLRKV